MVHILSFSIDHAVVNSSSTWTEESILWLKTKYNKSKYCNQPEIINEGCGVSLQSHTAHSPVGVHAQLGNLLEKGSTLCTCFDSPA